MARPSSPSEFIWSGRSTTNRAPISYDDTHQSPTQSSLIHDPIASSTAVTSESDEGSFCTCPNCGTPELISSGTADMVHLNRGFVSSPRAGTIDGDYDDCDHSLPHTPHHSPLPSLADYIPSLPSTPAVSEGELRIQNGLRSNSDFDSSSTDRLRVINWGPAVSPTMDGEVRGFHGREYVSVCGLNVSSDYESDAESYGSLGARSSVTAWTIGGHSSPSDDSPWGRATIPNSRALLDSPEGNAFVTNDEYSPGYRAGSPLLDAQYNVPPSSPAGSTSTTDHNRDHHAAPGPASAARVHAICLAASQKYLRAHVHKSALRHASSRPCRSRHSPYARFMICRFSPSHSSSRSVSAAMCAYHRDRYNRYRLASEYTPTSSILHNAGAICSFIWQHGRERSHGAEVAAAQEMEDMMRQAERIFAEWRLEEGDEGAEQGSEAWDEEGCIHVVGDGFCLALGDEDAMNEIWSGHEGGREDAWASSSDEEFEEEAPLEEGAW